MCKCNCGCPHCCSNSDAPHTVIDVSAWQEGIDMKQVKAEGVYGVIVKLGENYHETETARKQIFDALDAGLKVGVYFKARTIITIGKLPHLIMIWCIIISIVILRTPNRNVRVLT